MQLLKPSVVKYNLETGTVNLFFGEGSIAPHGRYLIRGGIAFPALDAEGDIKGAAVICGRHVDSKKIFVFEEHAFSTLNQILDKNGDIQFEGISHWFNLMWAQYYANTFLFHQDYETQRKFRIQVAQSQMINPKPQFVEVPFTEGQELHSVYEADASDRLFYSAEGELVGDMDIHIADPTIFLPRLHALACVVTGFDRFYSGSVG